MDAWLSELNPCIFENSHGHYVAAQGSYHVTPLPAWASQSSPPPPHTHTQPQHPPPDTPDGQRDGTSQPPKERQHVKQGLKGTTSPTAVHSEALQQAGQHNS